MRQMLCAWDSKMEKDEARLFIWINDVGNIIRVRMTVKMIEDQKLWKENVMVLSSGVEECPAQQRTSVEGECRTSVHQKELDVPLVGGLLSVLECQRLCWGPKLWNGIQVFSKHTFQLVKKSGEMSPCYPSWWHQNLPSGKTKRFIALWVKWVGADVKDERKQTCAEHRTKWWPFGRGVLERRHTMPWCCPDLKHA